MVLFTGEEMNTSAYKNSFHDSVKAKIPAERIPGMASGRMMNTIAWMRVAPSIRAHSSSSFGMVWK
jgi:hypothetical protein